MKYVTQVKVRFGDVDAAGIVFYPRYFEMLNAAVENWFEESLGLSFAEMHLRRGVGVPTVKVACEFAAPSFLGDTLDVELTVVKLGRSSCTIAFRMAEDGTERLAGRLVIVCMDLKARKAMRWPEPVRARMVAGTAAESLIP